MGKQEEINEGKKWIEENAGMTSYRYYRVVKEEVNGEKIIIKITIEKFRDWMDKEDNSTENIFYIDKNGKKMKGKIALRVPFVGDISSDLAFRFIDSKTSPEGKK